MPTDVADGSRGAVLHADDEVTAAKTGELLGVTRQFVDRLCADGMPWIRLPGSAFLQPPHLGAGDLDAFGVGGGIENSVDPQPSAGSGSGDGVHDDFVAGRENEEFTRGYGMSGGRASS